MVVAVVAVEREVVVAAERQLWWEVGAVGSWRPDWAAEASEQVEGMAVPHRQAAHQPQQQQLRAVQTGVAKR